MASEVEFFIMLCIWVVIALAICLAMVSAPVYLVTQLVRAVRSLVRPG